jgi:hypothetical protein
MSDVLDYAEKAGTENMKFRLQNAEALSKEANTVLTVLLAGTGGAMALAIKGFEQPGPIPTPMTIGAAGLAVWLMIVAALLIIYCMLSTDLPAPTNEPLNLYQPDFDLNSIRIVELKNLDERIKQVAKRNHRVAAWLDRVRLCAIASPLVFLTIALAWAALAPDPVAQALVGG